MPKNYNLFLKGDVGGWNFSSDMVNYVLDKRKGSRCDVLINSLGGLVHEALAISSLFKVHGDVHVHYVGMNASAATIAAMGAKSITIDADALFLVHRCSNLVLEWDYMNADQLEAHIKDLEKMKNDQVTLDGCVAGMYARRCKKSKDELLELMKEGAWLTAKQALEWGFVDEITNNDGDEKPALTAKLAESMAVAGIPVPPVVVAQEGKPSLMDRFMAFLSQIGNINPAAADNVAATNQDNYMDKFTALTALLGALSLNAAGNLELSAEQLGELDKALASGQQNLTSAQSRIAGLEAQVAAHEATIATLRNKPADTTTTVVAVATETNEQVSEAEAIAASKAFLASGL